MIIIMIRAGSTCMVTAVLLLGLVVSFDSFEMVAMIRWMIFFLFLWIFQNPFGTRRGARIISQFILSKDVEGSKIENRLFIMFTFF
jgi:hypothetical protein